MWHPTKEACQRLWGRRWVRRLTYLLAGGASVVWVGSTILERPAVTQWAVGKADAYLREETGLSLGLRRLEVHPFFGTLVLDDLALGGDLLTVKKIEVRLDPVSLLVGSPHFFTARITEPHARISPDRVARIRIKPHPERKKSTVDWVVDLLSVSGGQVEILEPTWGIPKGRLDFDLKGTGQGPQRLRLALIAPRLELEGPHGLERGRLDLQADVSDRWLLLHGAKLSLGASELKAKGALEAVGEHKMELNADAAVNLAQLFGWTTPRGPAPVAGNLRVQTQATGTLARPRWSVKVDGRGLAPADPRLSPGDLQLQAKGTESAADLERLVWDSSQGRVEASGRWNGHDASAKVRLANLSLDPLATTVRSPLLKGLTVSLDGDVKLPTDPDRIRRLELWEAHAQVALAQGGAGAGGFHAELQHGRAAAPDLDINLPDLQLKGHGEAQLDSRGLVSFQAEAETNCDAGDVGDALDAWKIVDLEMDGAVNAKAKVGWKRSTGLELDGGVFVKDPVWHATGADDLSAKATIHGDRLEVHDILVHKGNGQATGDLWLTWADLPKGVEATDMRFHAEGLPMEEGLKAADLDLPIHGTVVGADARIHGPLDHLMLDGQAQVADSSFYGVAVPAAFARCTLDIGTLALRIQDLRVAGSGPGLGLPSGKPSGDLALEGQGSMDLDKLRADLQVTGSVDTALLKLPVPPAQGRADIHLLGSLAEPFGKLTLPEGSFSFRAGRVDFEDQSLIGLEADLRHSDRKLDAQVGFERRAERALSLQARAAGEAIDADLQLKVAPESAPTHALGAQFTGGLLQELHLLLNAQGTWSPRGVTWQGRLGQLEGDFGAFDLRQVRPAFLRGTDKAAEVDLSLEGRQRGQEAGARATLVGTLPFSMTGPLDLRSTGHMDLGNLKVILDHLLDVDPYSLLGEMSLSGQGDYDLHAHGTYADPMADGFVKLDQGRLQVGGYPSMENLAFNVQLQGRTLTLPKDQPLKATLAQGDLSMDGQAQWSVGGLGKYDFNISLGGFQLRDLPGADGVDMQGSLAMTFRGDSEGGMLKGRVDADHLSYQADIKLSDLILRSALSESGGLSALEADDPLDRIGLDLDLRLSQPWICDTNLLKLEGIPEGSFKVMGTLAHPGLKGKMVFLPGGRVTNLLPAGDLVIDHGYLNFADPSTPDPYINLSGDVQLPGYLVNLDVHGTLSNLDIVPTSTPTLRRDEIVAILINPDYASTIGTASPSGAQGALTTGLASTSSGLFSTLLLADLQERLRKTLGLDRVSVSFRTGSTGSLERDIRLGKTLTLFDRRVPFLVSQRKTGELTTTAAQIEWRFGGVILQLGVSQTAGSGLDPTGEIRHTWSPR
ncbi:MAG TPA: translocation/assembly module TamB domain-containing protein [Holophagaceae bacterium]|nr:translocation/assembly module TamB domain-containing protein [Holophagaceae bacterium]